MNVARSWFCWACTIAVLMQFKLRKATIADVAMLRNVIETSVRGLQTQHYTPEQIEGALESVYGVDTQLIGDETYFVAELATASVEVVGCGGWSKRKTLFG